MAQIDDPQKLEGKRRARASTKTADGARLAPEQLIEALVLALHAESIKLAFPYLTMHRWSWRMLKAVKESCDPILRQLYTPAYMTRDSELPCIVGYILMAASGIDSKVQDLRPLQEVAYPINDLLINADGGRMALKFLSHMGINIKFEVEREEGGEAEDEETKDE